MNKNLFKTFAIAAMTVLAGACAKEQVGPGEGAMVEATFDVDVPGVEVSTKGLSDAASVNELICQVFLNDGNYTPVPDLNQTVTVTDKHAKVTFNLVKGQKYSFAFWAQAKGTGYYDTGNLRAVKMNVGAVKANDPAMDAYFAQKNFQAFSTATKDTKITLYRAVAQVNFGTINSDRKDKLGIVKSKIKLTEVPTVFDVVRGNMDDAYSVPAAIEFKENALVKEKLLAADKEYDYVATCYVFAHKNQKLTDATATFWVDIRDSKGNFTTTRTVSAPNAPYKRNMRTNILGDLLTVNQDFNIVVDPDFKGGDKTYDAVSANLEKGATVTLAENYSVDSKSKGVTLDVGVTSVLNLNGKKFSNENGLEDNKAALQVHGDLTINGDGEVYCNGGVFMAEAGSDSDATPATPFVLNQHDDITVNCFSVKGGTFVGFNPASVYEAHGAITSFVAEGYKSVKISESPETWQVVDASKTISDQAGLNSALGEASTGDYLKLPVGIYTLPALTKSVEGVTFEGKLGEDGNPLTVIDLASVSYLPSGSSYNYNNVTFKNIQFKTWPKNSIYKGFQHSGNLLFEGCTFTGIHFSYGNETYKKCKFIQEEVEYNMWVYGGTTVDYLDCTFEGKGKLLHVYNEGNPHITVNIQGCKFISTVSDKPAINIKGTCGEKALDYTVNIDNCTVSGAFPEINGGLWQVDKPATAEKNKITVNVKGEKVY